MFPRSSRRLRVERWQRNLYTIVAAQIVAMLGFNISVPFLPFYIQELGITDLNEVAFWVGLINGAAPLTMAVASPFWGALADRYGRKPMLVRSMLGGGLMVGLMAVVSNVPQLAFLRIVQGTLSGTVAAATTLVATTLPRERCTFGLGLLQTAIFAANSLGPSVGGFVGSSLGYRAAFVSSGVLLSLAGVLVLVLVHEEFVPAPRRKREGGAVAAGLRDVVAQPILIVMVGLLTMNSLAAQVTNPVLPLYVQTLVGNEKAATSATGVIIGAMAFANALSAIWVGRTADRLGRRRVLMVCLVVGSLVSFPQMLTHSPAQLLVLRFAMGLAMGGIIPAANAVIAERAPEGRQGGIYGMAASLQALGRALGPMLGTAVVTGVGIAAVFPVTGALLGLAAIVVALTTRALDRQPSDPVRTE